MSLLFGYVMAFVVMFDPVTAECVKPGTCVPPATKFSRVLPVTPRQQWNINGGFCGAVSFQALLLPFGAWVSQDLVRKANTHGTGHCSSGLGCEVDPTNVGQTAANLKLDYDEWDFNATKPQSPAYKSWMKNHLAAGHPVIWFVMCKGDDKCPYTGACPNGGAFGHIEPVWGLFSDHPLNDTTVYDDDWVVHSSDQDLEPYFRKFGSLQDSAEMQGNCAIAQPGFGRNEMYPCINDEVDYGLAINGIRGSGLPTALSVDNFAEPDTRMGRLPALLHGTVNVTGLTPGQSYTLYRITGTEKLPVNGNHSDPSTVKKVFRATTTSFVYDDPIPILSTSATYYRTHPTPSWYRNF